MTRLHVLHVDDDENIRALAALAFDLGGGAEVTSAHSGAEALRLLVDGLKPDVILLDVMMPEMDGPTLLARVAELTGIPPTPVVFMTAQTQDHEVAALMAAGATGVITKPFDPMTLAGQVLALLGTEA